MFSNVRNVSCPQQNVPSKKLSTNTCWDNIQDAEQQTTAGSLTELLYCKDPHSGAVREGTCSFESDTQNLRLCILCKYLNLSW